MRFSDVNGIRALSIHKCLRSIVTSGTWPAIDPELRSKSKQQNHWDMTGSKSPTGSTGRLTPNDCHPSCIPVSLAKYPRLHCT